MTTSTRSGLALGRDWQIERFTVDQPYPDVLARQLAHVEAVRQGHPPVLMIGEHPSVYTVGRGEKGPLPQQVQGIPVVSLQRGGRWSWHGPGQVVVYPIIPVAGFGGGLGYLRWLEATSLQALQSLIPSACLNPPATGLWLQSADPPLKKVASIGVAVRGGVAFHGLAVNVTCDLASFYGIEPCGLASAVMTTLIQSGCSGSLAVVEQALTHHFQLALTG